MHEQKEIKQEYKEKIPLKRIFLEVGTHDIPIPFLGKRKFKDDVYIGIDASSQMSKGAELNTNLTQRVRGENEALENNTFFVTADAKGLPLQDNGVDEVYFGNIFGDPRISTNEQERFLAEIERVLKKGGRMIVKKNNTPMDYDELVKMIIKHGFIIDKITRPTDKNWKEEMRPYHDSRLTPTYGSYILHLKKI